MDLHRLVGSARPRSWPRENAPLEILAENVKSPCIITEVSREYSNDSNFETKNTPIDSRARRIEALHDSQPKDSATPAARLSIRQSLGISGCIIVIGGSILVLAAAAFLSFLWFGAGPEREATHAPELWRRITLAERTPQAVTLTSLIIRTIVAYQAAVCVSMMAGLMLERRSVPRSQVAHFSILRNGSAGPLTMMKLIVSSKRLLVFLHIEAILTFLLLIETFGLQFASTILLSDMDRSPIASFTTPTQLQLLMSTSQPGVGTSTHAYSRQPPVYAVFGEVQSNATTRPDMRGYSATGIVQRAFLPLNSSTQRDIIRSYEGYSTVMSSHVACIKPKIQEFRYNPDGWDDWAGQYWGVMNGTLDYVSSLESAGRTPSCDLESCQPIHFSCQVPGTPSDKYGWQSNFCYVGGVGGTRWPGDTGPRGTEMYQPWSINSTMNMVYTTNIREEDWGSVYEASGTSSLSLTNVNTVEKNEWKSYELFPDRFVNVSLCFNSFNLMHTYVKMVAPGNVTEPLVTYRSDTGSANTGNVQSYFGTGATASSLEERGILQVSEMRNSSDPIRASSGESLEADRNLTMNIVKRAIYAELVTGFQPNQTIIACMSCATAGLALHDDLATVIEGTIQYTQRAADAIHIYINSLAMTIYYDFQKKFALSQEAAVSSVRVVLTAQSCSERNGCSGYLAVVMLAGAHVVIVCVTTVLYVTRTRFSRCSNVWHTVCQLLGEDLRETAENSYDKADKEVSGAMKSEAKDYLVRIGRSSRTQKIEILK